MKDEAMNGKIGKFLLGLACVLCAWSSDKVYTAFQPIDENDEPVGAVREVRA